MCPREGRVRAWSFKEWAHYPVDVPLESALVRDFDALLLPGGVMNPDALRIQKKAVAFVKGFFETGKPVAVICHGPWTRTEYALWMASQLMRDGWRLCHGHRIAGSTQSWGEKPGEYSTATM